MTCSSQGSQTEEAIQTTKEITPPHTLPAISHPFSISESQVLLLRSLPVTAPPPPISNAPNYPLTASEGLKDVTDEELPLLPSCLINVIWHLYRSAVHYIDLYRIALPSSKESFLTRPSGNYGNSGICGVCCRIMT